MLAKLLLLIFLLAHHVFDGLVLKFFFLLLKSDELLVLFTLLLKADCFRVSCLKLDSFLILDSIFLILLHRFVALEQHVFFVLLLIVQLLFLITSFNISMAHIQNVACLFLGIFNFSPSLRQSKLVKH